MAPHQLRNATLKQLREARAAMLELDYLLALEQLPDDKRREAALQLSRMQLAYLQLRTSQLKDIREGLIENEAELKSTTAALTETLKDLNQIETIVGAAAGFLKVVGRVISL